MNKRSPRPLTVRSYQRFHPPPGLHRTSDKWKLFPGNSMKNNHPAHFSSHTCNKLKGSSLVPESFKRPSHHIGPVAVRDWPSLNWAPFVCKFMKLALASSGSFPFSGCWSPSEEKTVWGTH